MGDPLKNFGVFGPMKWVPSTGYLHPTLEVPYPESHLDILGSWILGPGVSSVDVPGLGSQFSGMPIS